MQVILFCYGLLFGSFSNVLIDRIESGESVLWGRSHCDYCKKTLRWFELIPVFSFMMQGGKCRRCNHALSFQYPLVEIVTAVGYILLSRYIPIGPEYILLAIIYSTCIVMIVADFKYQIIPDEMVILGSLSSLGYIILSTTRADIYLHIAVATLAMLFFYCLWYGTKGRGMGFGDVKLAGMLGLLLGYPSIIFALYAAFLTGAAVGVILILSKNKTLKSKIAFGPFMIFGLFISIVFNQQLLHFWSLYF